MARYENRRLKIQTFFILLMIITFELSRGILLIVVQRRSIIHVLSVRRISK
jgi:hypothetical protein